MSTEIIAFIRPPKHYREQTDFPTIAFRSRLRSDDPIEHQADTAACEYAAPDRRDA